MIGKTKILVLAVAALLLAVPSVSHASCVSGSGKITKLRKAGTEVVIGLEGTANIFLNIDATRAEDKLIMSALLMAFENPDAYTVTVTNGETNSGPDCMNTLDVSVEPK
jgi:hypothetical protein